MAEILAAVEAERHVSRAHVHSSAKLTCDQRRCPNLDFDGRVTEDLCRRKVEHKVMVVEGEPGCGKTTTLPPLAYLVDSTQGIRKSLVLVVLPKRILVEEAANRLRTSLGAAGAS